VSKIIFHANIALLLLAACFCTTQVAPAQIAPTNSATISGSVSDNVGKPVAHATVSLSGPKNTSTQTDAQGLFVFVGVSFGTYSISAAAAGLGTATRSVSVQGDVNVAIQYEPASQNGLKVIANVSSSANAQFNVTPASITQVNPIANAFEGKTSWRTILEQIPGVAQAGLGNGQYNEAAYPDGPLVPMQISIDGALPYETATLLDDMPLIGTALNSAPGTGTNLGSYPLNGFDAADVVRGPGANAPSIVDSIGGSFVLHSPGTVGHNQYNFSVSTDPYGGVVANARAAVRWKKLSAVVTYGVNDSPGPISTATITPNNQYGLGGIATVDGQPFTAYSPACNPPGCEGGYLIDPNYSFGGFLPHYGTQGGLFVCCANPSTAWTQHSGSVALRYGFSPNVSAEVFYAGENSLMPIPYPYETFDFLPPAGYTGTIQPGMSLFNLCSANVQGSAFQNVSSLLEEKVTAQLGHGVLQLAALQNRSFSTFGDNYPTSGTVQLYGAGCVGSASPTTACPSGGTLTYYNGGTHSVTLPTADDYEASWSNNRDLLVSYVTPLGTNLHAGASFVKSYYDNPYTFYENIPEYDYSCVLSTPSAISQTTNEMRVFVGGNLSEKTSLDLSMYFVNANYHIPNPNNIAFYSTPGADINYVDSNYTYAAPRLGFVWRPTAAVAVRVAAGGGFAEAPLGDLIGSNAPFCSGGICTVTSPNLNLQPEKSFGFDLGTDIRLPRNTVFSFDVYHTNLYGQLYESTTMSGSCPGCGGLPLYVTQYGNLGESRYEGILLDVRHSVPHGTYWSLSGGLTRGYVVSVPGDFYNTANGTCIPATGANCTNLNVVPGTNFNGSYTNGASVPYAQGLGTLGYRWNADKYVDLVGTYYGNNNTYFRPAFVEFDGYIGYPLTRNVSLLVTFRNITGIYDGAYQIYTPSNLSGAPTISGLPYVLYGEEYGPRTVLFTTNLRL